jgi:hypothetical protein
MHAASIVVVVIRAVQWQGCLIKTVQIPEVSVGAVCVLYTNCSDLRFQFHEAHGILNRKFSKALKYQVVPPRKRYALNQARNTVHGLGGIMYYWLQKSLATCKAAVLNNFSRA